MWQTSTAYDAVLHNCRDTPLTAPELGIHTITLDNAIALGGLYLDVSASAYGKFTGATQREMTTKLIRC